MSGQGSDDAEKPHDPTPKKLEDARRKGEVPRSTDVTTAAAYGGFLLTGWVFGPASVERVGTAMQVMLDRADTLSPLLLDGGGGRLTAGLLATIGLALAPWILVPAVLVLLSLMAQRAFTVTGSKLAPKMNRISPQAGVKNKFGRNGLFEFAKSFAKLAIYSLVLAAFLRGQLPELLAAVHLEAGPAAAALGTMSLQFLGIVLIVAVVIGVVDMLWQRAEHHRKHMMSRKEIEDETKQAEGDPVMKQQRRQRGYDIAMNRMLADVPKADVVIVNPTHYAVALKWSRARGSAPVCVAKGVDEIAARIREMAGEAGVPIHRDPPAARALHGSVEVGQEIAPDHYVAVAAAIRYADRLRERRRQGV